MMKKILRMHRYAFAFMVLGSLLGVQASMSAKIVRVKSASRFYRALRKYPLAVVMFYAESKQMREQGLKEDIDAVERRFENVSQTSSFYDADVAFIKVNTEKRDLQSVANDFSVAQVPTVVLFDREGTIVRDKEGKNILMLSGYNMTTQQLQKFVEDNLGGDIQDILDEAAAARKRRQERRYYYAPYGGFGWGGYGYPYGGYGYGYPYGYGYGGRAGFGFYF